MKKITTALLATTLVFAMASVSFATEIPEGEVPMQGQMTELSEEALQELEALAEDAGMTLEEYMATMQPDEMNQPDMEANMEHNMESDMEQRPDAEGGGMQEIQMIATATTSAVYVDGVEISFEAYNIDGNNYFKLRDLAAVVSDSEKEFDVSWDSDLNAINLTSGSAYTVIGGELAEGDGISKTYSATTSTIFIDGVETSFEAYNIDGNNYFKLRDICGVFDIGVTWNSDTSSIDVDTSISYVE